MVQNRQQPKPSKKKVPAHMKSDLCDMCNGKGYVVKKGKK